MTLSASRGAGNPPQAERIKEPRTKNQDSALLNLGSWLLALGS
jgi:hypothetical protein